MGTQHWNKIFFGKFSLKWGNYRKSSIRSRPLIQVYPIRGRAIGGSVQALIIGKSLNPSKLAYLDHYGLVEIKKIALEIILFEIPLIQGEGFLNLK